MLDWKLVHFIKKKVKWSRYRPGVAQRVGRGIALLFHDCGTKRGWVVSRTPQLHFTPRKDPAPIVQPRCIGAERPRTQMQINQSKPIVQEAGWAPWPVWTGGKSRPHQDSIPDCPGCSSVAIPTELPSPRNYWKDNRDATPEKIKTPIWHMMSKNLLEFLSEIEIFWIKCLIDRLSSVLKFLVWNIFSSLHTK